MVTSGQANCATFAPTIKYTCCLVVRSSEERAPKSQPVLGIINSDDQWVVPGTGGKVAWWELRSPNREDCPHRNILKARTSGPVERLSPQETGLVVFKGR